MIGQYSSKYSPEKAIDGNKNTYWCTPKESSKDFWWYYIFWDVQYVTQLKINFKYEEDIEQISIYGQMNCDSIEKSLKSTPIVKRNSGSQEGFSSTYNIGSSYKCYAVRFQLKVGGTRYGAIHEIEFFKGKLRVMGKYFYKNIPPDVRTFHVN